MSRWNFKIIEPVAKFFNTLTNSDQTKVRNIFRLFEEYGPTLPAKYMKRMSGTKELWELKTKRIRVFFFITGNTGIGIHGILKKSQKTPMRDIEIALNRIRTIKEELI